jgi:hypothetical protein
MKPIRIFLISILVSGFLQALPMAQAANCRTIQNLSDKLRKDLVLNKPFTKKLIDENMKYYELALKQPGCVSTNEYKIIVETTQGIQTNCKKDKKGTWEYKQNQALWNNNWEYQCKVIKKLKVK